MIQIKRGGLARREATVLRWTARIVATVLPVIYLSQNGNVLQRLMGDQPLADDLYSIGFLIMLVGLAVGWLREEVGAALIVLGFIWAAFSRGLGMASGALGGLEIARSLLIVLPFLAVGVLYLASNRVARRAEESRRSPN